MAGAEGSPSRMVYSDRFIPSRAHSDVAARRLELGDDASCATPSTSEREARAVRGCARRVARPLPRAAASPGACRPDARG